MRPAVFTEQNPLIGRDKNMAGIRRIECDRPYRRRRTAGATSRRHRAIASGRCWCRQIPNCGGEGGGRSRTFETPHPRPVPDWTECRLHPGCCRCRCRPPQTGVAAGSGPRRSRICRSLPACRAEGGARCCPHRPSSMPDVVCRRKEYSCRLDRRPATSRVAAMPSRAKKGESNCLRHRSSGTRHPECLRRPHAHRAFQKTSAQTCFCSIPGSNCQVAPSSVVRKTPAHSGVSLETARKYTLGCLGSMSSACKVERSAPGNGTGFQVLPASRDRNSWALAVPTTRAFQNGVGSA